MHMSHLDLTGSGQVVREAGQELQDEPEVGVALHLQKIFYVFLCYIDFRPS